MEAFNWIDGLIILFLLFYLYLHHGRTFIYTSIELAGFVLSLILGLKFYPIAGLFLQNSFHITLGIGKALGFILITLIAEPLILLICIILSRFIPHTIIKSRINTMFGLIPSFISGLILTAFLLTASLALPIRPDIKQSITSSYIGGYITEKTAGFEKSVASVFGGAVQDSLNFLTVEPKSEESIDLHIHRTNVSVDASDEQTMFQLVNRERKLHGLQQLVFDSKLQDVGRLHCLDMFARGYFSHNTPNGQTPFDRMTAAHIQFLAAGENLAYAPTVDVAHTGLMESPGHRANILSVDFGHIGIGVIDGGVYGKMFCQEFTN